MRREYLRATALIFASIAIGAVGWSGHAVDEPSDVKVKYQSVDGTDYIVTDLGRSTAW